MNAINHLSRNLNLKAFKQQIFKVNITKRYINSVSDESKRQNDLFMLEQTRQRENIGRIEKIEVNYDGPTDNVTMIMNKSISTPYDCAKHLGDKFAERSAVALINNDTLWHMHKPLPDNCKLELLHYQIPNPGSVNKAFWRTCSFLLGAVISESFKDSVKVVLHSFPSPNVKSGSFVYDVELSLDKWEPTKTELKTLSLEFVKFCQQSHHIDTLDVDKSVAFEIFKNNPFKTDQIPDIAAHNGDKITLFKAGNYIDISRGPMISNTNHLGRISVTGVHKLDTDIKGLYRFQGVALPRVIMLNHFAYGIIEDRAKYMNSGRIPRTNNLLNEDNTFISQVTV